MSGSSCARDSYMSVWRSRGCSLICSVAWIPAGQRDSSHPPLGGRHVVDCFLIGLRRQEHHTTGLRPHAVVKPPSHLVIQAMPHGDYWSTTGTPFQSLRPPTDRRPLLVVGQRTDAVVLGQVHFHAAGRVPEGHASSPEKPAQGDASTGEARQASRLQVMRRRSARQCLRGPAWASRGQSDRRRSRSRAQSSPYRAAPRGAACGTRSASASAPDRRL